MDAFTVMPVVGFVLAAEMIRDKKNTTTFPTEVIIMRKKKPTEKRQMVVPHHQVDFRLREIIGSIWLLIVQIPIWDSCGLPTIICTDLPIYQRLHQHGHRFIAPLELRLWPCTAVLPIAIGCT